MAVSRLPGVRRQFLHGDEEMMANEIQILNIEGAISCSVSGCLFLTGAETTFPHPFPHACDGIWLQIKEFRQVLAAGGDRIIECPSGLVGLTIWPKKETRTRFGFELLWICRFPATISCVLADVDCLCFGH